MENEDKDKIQENPKQQETQPQPGQKSEKEKGEEEQNMKEYQEQMKMFQEQQELIRLEMEIESPLIGEKRDISVMLDQFVNNEGFYVKVQKMHEKYSAYRKTRRDGSCFYRALTFCIMEAIYVNKDKKLQEHMLVKMRAGKEFLLKAKYEGVIFEDILDMFVIKLNSMLICNIKDVVTMMCDPEISNYLVLMFRFLTAGEMKINQELYQAFIGDEIPIEMFCQTEVEPIDKEADQIQIMALLNYLGVGIKIIYLDSNLKTKEANQVILPDGIPKEQIKATLLYRPGHYDILYE